MSTEFKGCRYLQGMTCDAVGNWITAVKTPSKALEGSQGFGQVAQALDRLSKGVDWENAGNGTKAIALVLQAREQIKNNPPIVVDGDLCGRSAACPFYSPYPET